MRWYINQYGQILGPYGEQQLAVLMNWGKISREAYVCDEDGAAWIRVTQSRFAPILSNASTSASEGTANHRELDGVARVLRVLPRGARLIPGWLRLSPAKRALALAGLSILTACGVFGAICYCTDPHFSSTTDVIYVTVPPTEPTVER